MHPTKCCKYSGPHDRLLTGHKNTDMDPKLSDFITFLVVLPLAIFAIISHNSRMKPFFVIISILLICQFLTLFDPNEIKDLSFEIVNMVAYGLGKARDYLMEFKDRFMEQP